MAFARAAAFTLALALSAARGASAQSFKLDGLSKDLQKQARSLKPRLVAVVDFEPATADSLPQAHYFAWMLSGFLAERAKKNFSVAEHMDFDADLRRLNISSAALDSAPGLKSAAPNLGPDVLITGTIEKRGHDYLLRVTPVRVADFKSAHPLEVMLETNEFLESFSAPFPENVRRFSAKTPHDQGAMPRCLYCPDPAYNDLARRDRLQGVLVMEVLITAEGRAGAIHPVHFLGDGLDEQAFYAVKKWKFQPAKSSDGTPIPVIVPIEVTFRMF